MSGDQASTPQPEAKLKGFSRPQAVKNSTIQLQ